MITLNSLIQGISIIAIIVIFCGFITLWVESVSHNKSIIQVLKEIKELFK